MDVKNGAVFVCSMYMYLLNGGLLS